MDELKLCLSNYSIDIACVTETHLTKDIDDNEVEIEGFSIVRGDRDFDLNVSSSCSGDHVSEKGGSIIYYRNFIDASENLAFKKLLILVL